MEAQRRKAEARRLKKQRALALAQAAREAANEAKAAEDGEGEGDDEEETEVAAATAGEETEEEAECPICLLELSEAGEGSKTLGCGHVYHAGCIADWVDRCRRKDLTLTCPYCREKISV
jgi:hypothetical protein